MTQEMAKDEDFKLLKIKTCTLKVNLHCEGCKHKVKKTLQRIEGVYQVSIDGEQQKVTVSGSVEAAILIKKLLKAGKYAEVWSNKSNNNKSQSQNHMKDDKKNKGLEPLKKQQKSQPLTSKDDEDLMQKQQEPAAAAVSANNPKKNKNKSQPNNANVKKVQAQVQNVGVGGQNGNFVCLNEGKNVKLNNNLGGYEVTSCGQMVNMNGLRYNQQQHQGYNNQSAGASFMVNLQNRQAMYQRSPTMPPTFSYYYNYNIAPYTHGNYYYGGNGGVDDNMWSDENTSFCSVM
ncbi:uncharacterized protein LOC143597656 [Bidens hawaiensis]|uniref:uncharacterized protein LOC143597656 n=1 Tax=Bidens hawaiensis TaxID=980011 RepID=UPI00404A4CD7